MASFRDQIQAHAGTGALLTRAQERALLRLGTAGYGLDYDGARGAVFDAAAGNNLVLESAVEDTVADYLRARAGAPGRVSRPVFMAAVDLYRSRVRGQIGPDQAAIRVKDLMIRRGLEPGASGVLVRSRRWFNRIPRPVAGAETAATAIEVSSPVAAPAGVQAPVQETLAAWAQAFNARNVPAVLALYAPDALLLATASAEPLRGPEAMRAYFEQLLVAQAAGVQFQSTLAVAGTDPATASGLYVFTWTGRTGRRVTSQARFTYVITRAGSGPSWLIRQHHSSAIPTTLEPDAACPV